MTTRPYASEMVENSRALEIKGTQCHIFAKNIFLKRGVGPHGDPRESIRPYLARKAAKAPWRVHEVKNKQDSAGTEEKGSAGREREGHGFPQTTLWPRSQVV